MTEWYEFTQLLQTRGTIVSLDRWRINLDGLFMLKATLMDESNQIQNVNLSQNLLSTSGLKIILEAIVHENNRVVKLILSNNRLSTDSMRLLAETLGNPHNQITALDLSHNPLTSAGVSILVQGLAHRHCKIRHLNLGNVDMDEEALSDLAKYMCTREARDMRCSVGSNRRLASHAQELMNSLHLLNQWRRTTEVLLSGRIVDRISVRSELRHVPCDVLRKIAECSVPIIPPSSSAFRFLQEQQQNTPITNVRVIHED